MVMRDVFVRYTQEVEPLLLDLEIRRHQLPVGVLDEFRKILRRVATVCQQHCPAVEKSGEPDVVDGHIRRVESLCLRSACDEAESMAQQFLRTYADELAVLKDGAFLRQFWQLRLRAQELLKQAVAAETEDPKNVVRANGIYREAMKAYREFSDFVLSSQRDGSLNEAVSQMQRLKKSEERKHFLVGVAVGTVLAASVYVLCRALVTGLR